MNLRDLLLDTGASFRSKALITFIWIHFLLVFFVNLLSVYKASLQLGFKFSYITSGFISPHLLIPLIAYVLFIIFAVKKEPWAWAFPIIPALWFLFNPLQHPSGAGYNGTLLNAIMSVVYNDPLSALFNLGQSVFLLSLLIYSITNLATELSKYNNRKFDILFGSVFMIFAIFEIYGSPWIRVTFLASPTYQTVLGLIFAAIYICLILIWQLKLDKQKIGKR